MMCVLFGKLCSECVAFQVKWGDWWKCVIIRFNSLEKERGRKPEMS